MNAAGKTALYVGASPERRQLADELAIAGWQLTLLEIHEPNAQHYRERLGPFVEIVTGDVRDLSALGGKRFDLAVWWHGPEHVAKDEAKQAISALSELAGMVVLATPAGKYAQGAVNGNPHEAHISWWTVADFEAIGFRAEQIGTDGHCDSHVLAWKGEIIEGKNEQT